MCCLFPRARFACSGRAGISAGIGSGTPPVAQPAPAWCGGVCGVRAGRGLPLPAATGARTLRGEASAASLRRHAPWPRTRPEVLSRARPETLLRIPPAVSAPAPPRIPVRGFAQAHARVLPAALVPEAARCPRGCLPQVVCPQRISCLSSVGAVLFVSVQDLPVVVCGVDLGEYLFDPPLGVDDERRAQYAHVFAAVHRLFGPDPVSFADAVVGVGEQREIQVVLLAEAAVRSSRCRGLRRRSGIPSSSVPPCRRAGSWLRACTPRCCPWGRNRVSCVVPSGRPASAPHRPGSWT